ncbi:site-specific DNA-methyltransferase [Brooklawnia propionicigenes]|uniref:Site-specific DNA-methyltransferase n=1 Tax=Brooklawnia propionicigenes TaxID=3041175 RepID=A0AAN0MIE5_9ACTN|nr:site-specific DNA-methyltransferase [Brooklawnia sp. SH051]BEH03099.1 site-specific DNA-methyltransferase [Brooklawnia sp. SH051]
MEKLRMTSPDLTEANIDKLADLFPTVVTETLDDNGNPQRAVDFDLLRQELSDHIVEGPQERYRLDWPGKRAAAFAANAPVAKTLRPVREESVDFDTTKNLFIEGDNLDALKLLQESYLGKVGFVYIDPPYNTGNDFIYDDDFAESTESFLNRSGQVDDEGVRLVANTDANGRYHSDWLSMIYPRVKLARNLMTDDGVFFVSIDDHEYENLKKILDEVFGAQNFLNAFVWISNLKGRQISKSGAAGTKEYILCYARNAEFVSEFLVSGSESKTIMPSIYKGFNYEIKSDAFGPYVTKNELYNTNSAFNEETRPNLVFDIYFNPHDRQVRTAPVSESHKFPEFVKISPHANGDGVHKYHAFRWSASKVESESQDLEFVETTSGWRVYTKVRNVDSTSLKDLIMGISTTQGTKDIEQIGFTSSQFSYPKPVSLIQLLIAAAAPEDAIVLDYFAGSGTAAHATLAQNAKDGQKRKFILVQLPEQIDTAVKGVPAEFEHLADMASERVRRAANQLSDGGGFVASELDGGFRYLRVDSSNKVDVLRSPEETAQLQIGNLEGSIRSGRSGEDLLFQVLLDWGLELSLSITRDDVDGHEVFVVDDGALIACFTESMTPEVARAIAERGPLRVVFRDDAFGSDAARINTEQIFRELSPSTEVRAI